MGGLLSPFMLLVYFYSLSNYNCVACRIDWDGLKRYTGSCDHSSSLVTQRLYSLTAYGNIGRITWPKNHYNYIVENKYELFTFLFVYKIAIDCLLYEN